jgi:hypothetical protein
VILVSGQGIGVAAVRDGSIENWVRVGHSVQAIDLRGYGEQSPDVKPQVFGADWKEAFLSIHLNRPLVGQRAGDLLSWVKGLGPNDFQNGATLVALGSAVPAALHAAVLEPRFKEVVLENGLTSWSSVVKSPKTQDQLANVVPGILATYDLPDLAALLAPRKLTITNPLDPTGKSITQGQLEALYARAREAYKAAGAEQNLLLQAAP